MDAPVDIKAAVTDYQQGLLTLIEALPLPDIETLVRILERAYEEGRRVFVAGNGGSAATASHLACDLDKTVLGSSPQNATKRFKVIALTDNVPLITAYGNDVGYESIFAEPLCNLADPGDVLVVITASGNSANVVEAVARARDLGLTTVGLLGFEGGRAREMLDHAVVIPSENFGHIEDLHLVLVHAVTHYFKLRLATRSETSRLSPGAV